MQNDEGTILEFVKVGDSVKITAVDPTTGIEACVIAPPNTPRHDMQTLAINKLRYVMKKHTEANATQNPTTSPLNVRDTVDIHHPTEE